MYQRNGPQLARRRRKGRSIRALQDTAALWARDRSDRRGPVNCSP